MGGVGVVLVLAASSAASLAVGYALGVERTVERSWRRWSGLGTAWSIALPSPPPVAEMPAGDLADNLLAVVGIVRLAALPAAGPDGSSDAGCGLDWEVDILWESARRLREVGP